MTRFILTKRKNAKLFSGAITIKKGANLNEVRKRIRKSLPKNMTFKIVSEAGLKKLVLGQIRKR